MDSLDDQHSGHVKKEFWYDHGDTLLQDEHGVRGPGQLVQSPDHLMQQGNSVLRSFSTVDCLEGVKVELTDPTDLMMLSHARRIRGFSRKRQLQVEMKIAQLVMEAEREEVEAEEERDMTAADPQSP